MDAPLHVVVSRDEDVLRAHAANRGTAGWQADGTPLWPLAVEIQPTSYCHRTCSFCSHIVRNRRGGELDLATISQLLADLEQIGVRKVALSGGGEPLTWGFDRLGIIAREAASFAEVSLTTSGDQLWDAAAGTLEPSARVLLKSFRALYLNVPDIDDEAWRRQIALGNSAADAKNLIAALVRAKVDDLDCKIFVVVVVTQANIPRIASLDRTLSELGVDGIYYKQFKNFESRNVRQLSLTDDEMHAAITQAVGSSVSPSLARFLQMIGNKFDGHVPCWANRLSFSAIIDPDGDLFLCTPYVGRAEYSIGNIRNRSFRELWASAVRRRTILTMSSRSADGLCPAECREHPVNHAIDNALVES